MAIEVPDDQEVIYDTQKWPDGPPELDAIFLGDGQLALKGGLAMKRVGLNVGVVGKSKQNSAGVIADVFYTGDITDGRYFAKPIATGAPLFLDTEHVDQPYLLKNAPREQMMFPVEGLAYTQDKLIMHQKLRDAGLPMPKFIEGIYSLKDLMRAAAQLEFRGMAQKRKGAYDGRGNALISGPESVRSAWKKIGNDDDNLLLEEGNDLFIEEFVDFEEELAIQIFRGLYGETVTNPLVVSRHHQGQLYVARSANYYDPRTWSECAEVAQNVSALIPGVGPITVEFFKLRDQDLKPDQLSVPINEICSGRSHNSQHHTQGGLKTSQFDQLALLAQKERLGSVAFRDGFSESQSVNLLGTRSGGVQILGIDEVEAKYGVQIQAYGKKAEPNRKLGDMGKQGNIFQPVEGSLEAALIELNDRNDNLFQYHPELFKFSH